MNRVKNNISQKQARIIPIFAVFLLAAGFIYCGENLIKNADFSLRKGCIPEFWSVSQDKSVISIADFNGTKVLEIREDSTGYVSALVTSVNVEGSGSYFLSTEYRLESISNKASAYYYWLDKTGKVIGNEHYLFKAGSSSDWNKSGKIIMPDDPLRTRGLRLCLAVYGKQGGKGKAFFRRPVLSRLTTTNAAEAEKLAKAAVKKKQSRILDNSCFMSDGQLSTTFTCKMPGLVYHVEKNRPGVLLLHTVNGVKYSHKVNVDIELPQQVMPELFLYKTSDRACRYVASTATDILPRGRRKITYMIPTGYDWSVWGNSLFFLAGPDARNNFKIVFRIYKDDGTVLVELPAEVEIIPAAGTGKTKSNFRLYSWYSHPLARIAKEDALGRLPKKMLTYWQDSGFAGTGDIPFADTQQWREMIDLTKPLLRFSPHNSRNENSPNEPRTAEGISGAPFPDLYCPSDLAAYASEFFRDNLTAFSHPELLAGKDKWLIVDYEPYNYGWITKTCFCEKCLDSFAKHAGIPRNQFSRKDILEKHLPEWISFRCKQRTTIVKAMTDFVAEINPEANLLLCSMPMPMQNEENDFFKRYGVDLRQWDKFTKLHAPMCYENGLLFYRRVERMAKSLRAPVMPVLANYKHTNHPERIAQQIMACGFLGMRNIMLWRGLMLMDGKALGLVRQALLSLDRSENFVSKGVSGSSEVNLTPGFGSEKNLYSASRSVKDSHAVLLLNDSDSQVSFVRMSLKNPDKASYVLKSFTDNSISQPMDAERLKKGLTLKVPPLGMRFFCITDADFDLDKAESGKIILEDSSAEESRLRENFARLTAGKSAYGMKCEMGAIFGKSGFIITTPAQRMLIDLADCGVAYWETSFNGEYRQAAHPAGRDRFSAPTKLMIRNKLAELTHCNLLSDRAECTVSFTLAAKGYTGLRLEKTYTVFKDKAELGITVKIYSEQGYRPYSYNAVNIMAPGMEELQKKSLELMDYSAYVLPESGGTFEVKNNKRIVTCPRAVGGSKGFDESWCIFRNTLTGAEVKVKFDESAKELVFWRKRDVATVEIEFGPAYTDNDPHKVSVWGTAYRLICNHKKVERL